MMIKGDSLTEDTKSFLALSKILDNLVLDSNFVDISLVELKILVQVKNTEGTKLSQTNWISRLTKPKIKKALKKLLGEGLWNRNRTPLLERIDGKLYLTMRGALFLDGLLISNSGQISASNPGLVKIRISEDFSLLHKQEEKPNNTQLFFDRIREKWLDSSTNKHQIMGHLIADHCLRVFWASFIYDASFVMDFERKKDAEGFYALLSLIGHGTSKKGLSISAAFGELLVSLKDIYAYFESKKELDAYERQMFKHAFGCINEKSGLSEDSIRQLSIKISSYQSIVGRDLCNLDSLHYSILESDLITAMKSKGL